MEKILLAADETNISLNSGAFKNIESYSVSKIISFLIQSIFVVAGLIAFILLIVGGVRWITSGGDKEKTAKAQSTITAAVIGLLIVFAAWALIKLLEVIFGISILNATIPTIINS